MQQESTFDNILALLRQNDPAALGILFQQYGRRLVSYARKRWQLDANEAWELIYQTFDVLLLKAERLSFTTQVQFDGFIFSVFTNKLYEAQRKRQRDPIQFISIGELEPLTHSDSLSDKEDSLDLAWLVEDWSENITEDDIVDSVQVTRLNQALSTLPQIDRDLLLLWAQGYTYSEIGKMLNIDDHHLKVRCYRAKQKIVNWFTKQEQQ